MIALWGAAVATILGVKEIQKSNKNLLVLLEELRWSDGRYQVIITNKGIRPITIIDIHVFVASKGGGGISRGISVWDESQPDKHPAFPFTLQDSETVLFPLSRAIIDYYSIDKYNLGIVVYDGEGNTYSKYKKGYYDLKWGYHNLGEEKSFKPYRLIYWWYRIFRRQK